MTPIAVFTTGWGGMVAIVFGGVVLNALLIRLAAQSAERAWARRFPTTRPASLATRVSARMGGHE